MKYSYANTTKVFFTDKIEDVKNYLAELGYVKPLIVTGENSSLSIAKITAAALSDKEYRILSGVSTNASSEFIEKNMQDIRYFSPDVIITVGGGSVHDTGKAIAVMLFADNDTTLEDFTVDGKLSVPGITNSMPVITIPTLVGSGAEVSPAALVRINNKKRVIFSPLLHPVATFINIAHLESLSDYQLGRSSFDSLIQALEGFISTNSNVISNAFACETISYFNEVYPALKKGNVSLADREKLAFASIMSSYVCSTASVGAIHALSDPISGRFNTHHGEALALVAVDVLKHNLEDVNDVTITKLDDLLYNIESRKTVAKERVIDKINSIIIDLGLLCNKGNFNLDTTVLDAMVKESFNPDMAGNPHNFTEGEVKLILGAI